MSSNTFQNPFDLSIESDSESSDSYVIDMELETISQSSSSWSFSPISDDLPSGDDSDADADTVYENVSPVSLPEDESDVVSLTKTRAQPHYEEFDQVMYVGFSSLSQFGRLKTESVSSFTESVYRPGHYEEEYWVKRVDERLANGIWRPSWVRMCAFVPITEDWRSFFSVRCVFRLPLTLEYELDGLSSVLQLRGLSGGIQLMFLPYLMDQDVYMRYPGWVDRTVMEKIDFVVEHLAERLDMRLNDANPVEGLSEGLDRPYCLNCGEPKSGLIAGVRHLHGGESSLLWKASNICEGRYRLCEGCKNRLVKVRHFERGHDGPLEVVANPYQPRPKVKRVGSINVVLSEKPELWLLKDYVCPISGVARTVYPWDLRYSIHLPSGEVLEMVEVHPVKWSLAPRYVFDVSTLTLRRRDAMYTGRNFDLEENQVLSTPQLRGPPRLTTLPGRKWRGSQNFLSVVNGRRIHDQWIYRPFGSHSGHPDFGRWLYGQMRWGELPTNGAYRFMSLKRMYRIDDLSGYETFEITPLNRGYGQSRLSYVKGIALFFLLAFAGKNPYLDLDLFLHPKDFAFSGFFRSLASSL